MNRQVELAVLNNVCWYRAMFAAHGLQDLVDGRVWLSHQMPPAFHSNLVVLSRNATRQQVQAYVREIEQTPRPGGW